VVWLAGVRRVGKTFLCRSLADTAVYDCELPRIRRQLEDPEDFLEKARGRRIVLDEIHRLANPSELLKIAADHYPSVKLIATGSSTLGASRKFRDTLTGRKTELWLTPMISADLKDFKREAWLHRFVRGGLPPFFLAEEFPESGFQEWMDAYWAKDIQELFRLERKHSFQRFAELLFAQSGGMFEATRFSGPCEVSRPTVRNYLAIMENTFVAHVVRPFSRRRATEIVAAPKVYGFDTGFVCYYRGWYHLRPDDMGVLWEHFVLNEVQAHLQRRDILYWRDKQGHEVDFVVASRSSPPTAIECKWKADQFDPGSLQIFRKHHPEGRNYVVASDVAEPFARRYGAIQVVFTGLGPLTRELVKALSAREQSH
jgi:hypothetical protein